MPRTIGARCGVKSTSAPRLCSISGGVAVVEQAVGGEVLVDRAEVEGVLRGAGPAPETPEAASTMSPVAPISPARTNGARASTAAVG